MKNVFQKRVTPADIKLGAVLYPVFSITGSVAEADGVVTVTKETYQHGSIGKRFCFSSEGVGGVVVGNIGGAFFKDWNIGNDDELMVNFHAIFLNENDRHAYINAINYDELPVELKKERNRLVEERQRLREDEDNLW